MDNRYNRRHFLDNYIEGKKVFEGITVLQLALLIGNGLVLALLVFVVSRHDRVWFDYDHIPYVLATFWPERFGQWASLPGRYLHFDFFLLRFWLCVWSFASLCGLFAFGHLIRHHKRNDRLDR